MAIDAKVVSPIAAVCTKNPYCMTCAAPDVCTECMPGYHALDGEPCTGNKYDRSYHKFVELLAQTVWFR